MIGEKQIRVYRVWVPDDIDMKNSEDALGFEVEAFEGFPVMYISCSDKSYKGKVGLFCFAERKNQAF